MSYGADRIVYYLGSFISNLKDGVAKEKVPGVRRPEVGITVFASTLMYVDCMHTVMLKPASVHFTFISG